MSLFSPGMAIDTQTGETFINLEAERRLSDHLSAELRLRTFTNAGADDDALYAFERDDYAQPRLSWHYEPSVPTRPRSAWRVDRAAGSNTPPILWNAQV